MRVFGTINASATVSNYQNLMGRWRGVGRSDRPDVALLLSLIDNVIMKKSAWNSL